MANAKASIMETSSGKILDEVCNKVNEAYNDELLYAAWFEPPRVQSGLTSVAVSAFSASTMKSFQCFMARLSVCEK